MTTLAAPAAPVSFHADQADTLWGIGEKYHLHLSGAHTGGALELMEVQCWPGGGPPPHIHHHEDEAFFVLEGEMEFLLGTRIVSASAGQAVWAPRGQVHQFRVTSANSARYLLLVAPAKLEKMFRQFGQPCPRDATTPPAQDPALGQKVLEVAQSFGIEIVPTAAGISRETIQTGPGLWVFGVHIHLLITGADTDGRLAVNELIIPPNGGPPPHIHQKQSETFYVLEGAVELRMADRTVIATPGTIAHIPARNVHAFRGVGPGVARMISMHDPAGIELFFREFGVEGPVDQAPAVGLPDPQRMLEILQRHDITVAPPDA